MHHLSIFIPPNMFNDWAFVHVHSVRRRGPIYRARTHEIPRNGVIFSHRWNPIYRAHTHVISRTNVACLHWLYLECGRDKSAPTPHGVFADIYLRNKSTELVCSCIYFVFPFHQICLMMVAFVHIHSAKYV